MSPSTCKRGVQRGATPLAGGMEVSPSTCKRGVQRGATPLAGVWGCPPGLLIFPPSWKEGGQGDGPSPNRSAAPKRGVQSNWLGGCASINSFLYFPPFLKEGGQGDGPPTSPCTGSPEGAGKRYGGVPPTCKQGVQRGITPLAGVWGCPPGLLIIPPFLEGRGPGGWWTPPSSCILIFPKGLTLVGSG